MPELPEVEGVVRELRPIIEGKTIKHVGISPVVIASHRAGKQSIVKGSEPTAFAQALEGMQIIQVERRSKYIFLHLMKQGEPYVLINHLGMTGAWFTVHTINEIREDKFRKHAHVMITFMDDTMLVYADIRRFGECRLVRELSDHPPLLKMAPEPFDDDAYAFFLAQSELPKYAKKAIKEVIMDGHVISGCGNIYATEALFHERIRPTHVTGQLHESQKRALFIAITTVLQQSIDRGGSSISDYRNINGEAGGMQDYLQMYGKKVCPLCGEPTSQETIAGRTSTYCGGCQH